MWEEGGWEWDGASLRIRSWDWGNWFKEELHTIGEGVFFSGSYEVSKRCCCCMLY